MELVPKEDKELLTRDKTFVIPNFMEEASMFEWAGIGFGEEETYKLSKSVKVPHHPLLFLNFPYRDWQL